MINEKEYKKLKERCQEMEYRVSTLEQGEFGPFINGGGLQMFWIFIGVGGMIFLISCALYIYTPV